MHVDFDQHGEPVRLHLTRDEWRACTEFDQPDWEPLEHHVPATMWGEFMWMYRVRPEGKGIEAYKHTLTRQYLHLDHNNRAWQWNPDGTWTQIPVTEALADTLDPSRSESSRDINTIER